MHLKVLPGPVLAQRTTLRLGGPALAEIHLGSERALDELPGRLEELGGRPLALGHGSNVLAADGPLPVVLLRVPEGDRPEAVFSSGEETVVRVGAGMGLPVLLSWCARHGLSGLEGLAGIPGGVGGAVAMNAGSFGTDMSRVLERVLLYSPCCGLRWAGRDDVRMGYRFFAPRTADRFFLVLGVELRLTRAEPEAVRAALDVTWARKRASQPLAAASAGCVFKNPEGAAPAGRLLDEAGFKGRRLGGMAFSELHANFLVNLGGGTAAQAFELIQAAREAVAARSGVALELEVKVVE
jgi:UDP-N-acetylmuramate dehydrogenase